MKQLLETTLQWQMTILNSKQPINKDQQVWTTTHSRSRSSQAEAEETEATLVQETQTSEQAKWNKMQEMWI